MTYLDHINLFGEDAHFVSWHLEIASDDEYYHDYIDYCVELEADAERRYASDVA